MMIAAAQTIKQKTPVEFNPIQLGAILAAIFNAWYWSRKK